MTMSVNKNKLLIIITVWYTYLSWSYYIIQMVACFNQVSIVYQEILLTIQFAFWQKLIKNCRNFCN